MPGAAGGWQRLSKRQQLLAFVSGGVLVVGGVDAVALRPLRRQVSRLHEEVHETEQRFLGAVVASYTTRAVGAALPAYGPYLKPSGSSESELAGVLSEVESAVRQSGVTLLNLKPATSREGAGNIISVLVEAEATPTQLVQLLDQLQRSAGLLKVTELNVRLSESKTLRASLVISKLLLK